MLKNTPTIACFAMFAVVMGLTCKNCHCMSVNCNPTNQTEEYIPNKFQCPISQMLMIRPVITEHNKSYDEWAIEKWIHHQSKSNIIPSDPQTRAIFQTFELTVDIPKMLPIHSWIAQSYVSHLHNDVSLFDKFWLIFVVNSVILVICHVCVNFQIPKLEKSICMTQF